MSDLGLIVPRPVRVTLDGAELYVPPRSATNWLRAIDTDPRTAALQLLETDDRNRVTLGLMYGAVFVRDCERVTHQALAELTGHKWWWALRMVYLSSNPEYLGELVLSGVDPDKVSLYQWCAATYRIHTKHAGAKDKMRLDFELELPPPGVDEDAWDDDDDYYKAMLESARKLTKG